MTQTRMSVRAAMIVTAAALVALLIALAPADADAAKIVMKGKTEGGLRFDGPDSLERGKKLRIVNDTNPKKVGPHSFTLIEEKLIPKNEKQGEACYGPGGICIEIFEAHKVDEEAGTVGKPSIDVGRKGWDVEFSEGDTGDSWFTQERDETEARKLKAKVNKRLSYFCVIHPWMQGSLRVK